VTIERACKRPVRKPWGSIDLRPWYKTSTNGATVGEVWFQRSDNRAPDPALLLKLLFTSRPLSIQVHPDDAFAQLNGSEHGKTEAWYILSATDDAQIAIGLKRKLTSGQLRTSIEDGSIAELVQWRRVGRGDVIFVPAGTIHSIGAGLVIAEIQQRSDTTFRLFDYGRHRELHVDKAVAAANEGRSESPPVRRRLNDVRTLLVASQAFVLERIDLKPQSNWVLGVDSETWILVIEGNARIEKAEVSAGDAIFLIADSARIEAGPEGTACLLAYVGPEPKKNLLIAQQDRSFPRSRAAGMPIEGMEVRS
jgi:mannose-6-phosphate isomerase